MAFTIECGIVTVGLRFERRFLASPLQIHVAKRFVLAVCPDSRKPPRELLWKTDPKRPLIGLRNHLTESISGILLEQSGEVVRILELTFFFLAESGVRALALATSYISGTIHFPSTDASFPVLAKEHCTDCLILDIPSWP